MAEYVVGSVYVCSEGFTHRKNEKYYGVSI